MASDYRAASWETDGTRYHARVLIGPGSAVGQLAEGLWWVGVKVTDNPEAPVVWVDALEIT